MNDANITGVPTGPQPETGETQPLATESKPKQLRGFACMDPERRRQIASLGGKASHEKGTGHEWDRERAREAGRKGGLASRGGRGRERPPQG